jgi:hypothetical protein
MEHYYRVKPESPFNQKMQKSRRDVVKFEALNLEMCMGLGIEPTNRYSINKDEFYVDLDLPLEPTVRKLFTNSGYLKKNSKRANELRKTWIELVAKHGLSAFQPEHVLRFTYGVMRRSREQKLSTLWGLDTLYVHTDYDMHASAFTSESFEFLDVITEKEFVTAHLAVIESKEPSPLVNK